MGHGGDLLQKTCISNECLSFEAQYKQSLSETTRITKFTEQCTVSYSDAVIQGEIEDTWEAKGITNRTGLHTEPQKTLSNLSK